MKLFTLIIYILLTLSWLYIFVFSIKEYIKGKFSSKSLFSILFIILIIDSIRTLIESTYFGTRLASQYGVIPKELFTMLSNPAYLFIPKLINAIAAITIIILIFKKWYPEKVKDEQEQKLKYEKELKNKKELEILNKELDKRVKEKTKELEILNKNLERRVKEEVEKNKEHEQKLFSQSKMAAMGEMLKNIAHQWRQPLSTISTISSGTQLTVEANLIKKEEIQSNLEQITKTAKYMSQTIDDFQNYFKPNKDSVSFETDELIKNTLDIIKPMLNSNYIEVQIDKKDSYVLFGPFNEYTQVLMNLFSNSKDAFLENNIDNRLIKIIIFKENDKCIIDIIDNAGGINENIINRVFEPYFTTKHQETGTGLGLYMSKEIVEKHIKGSLEPTNVDVTYKNTTRKGAQFRICINCD